MERTYAYDFLTFLLFNLRAKLIGMSQIETDFIPFSLVVAQCFVQEKFIFIYYFSSLFSKVVNSLYFDARLIPVAQ